MEFKRAFGFVFIFAGVVILISNFSLTGAVVGTDFSNSLSLLAVFLLFIGAVFLISERRRIDGKIEELVGMGVSRDKISRIQEGVMSGYSKLSKEARREIYDEISTVMSMVQNGQRAGGAYNLHVLNGGTIKGLVDSGRILEADAKVLNKYANGKRRGTERYIFNSETGELLGIAYHARGGPRRLSWRYRF